MNHLILNPKWPVDIKQVGSEDWSELLNQSKSVNVCTSALSIIIIFIMIYDRQTE